MIRRFHHHLSSVGAAAASPAATVAARAVSSTRAQVSAASVAAANATVPVATRFDKLQQEQEQLALWGRPFLAGSATLARPGAAAAAPLEAIARLGGYDPVLEQLLPPSALRELREDAFGADLLADDAAVRRASEALFTAERSAQFLAALRRARARGGAGSSVGLPRATATSATAVDNVPAAPDEADRADTTWARDGHFTDLAAAVHDITGVAASNLEGLLAAVRRAGPEQLARIYSNRALQPLHTTLPYVPSDAGWAMAPESDELKAWCAAVHKARAEADAFMEGPLRAAASRAGWPAVAADLAAQRAKMSAVLGRRRARVLKQLMESGTAAAAAAEAEAARREAVALVESETTGEFDAAGEDGSEEFLLEHDELEKIADEPLPSAPGVTLRLVWLHGERLDALLHQHVCAGPAAVALRAACIARAWADVDGGAAGVERDLQAALRNSEFDSRGAFVVPQPTPGWVMLQWHRFGASAAVVQHSPGSSSRVLLARAKTLRVAAAAARLHAKLRPLSSSIELSTPFQHRRSLVAAVAEYLVAVDAAGQERANTALEALDRQRHALHDAVRLIAEPLGAARRNAYAARRKLLAQNDVPLSAVDIVAGPSAAAAAWPMGGVRTVRFAWPTPLLDLTAAELQEQAAHGTRAATPDGALLREASRLRTCVTVALYRARPAEQLQAQRKQREEHVARLQKLLAEQPRVADHILRQLRRVASPTDGGSSTGDVRGAIGAWLAEADGAEWEFVCMLDDAVHIYPTGSGSAPDTRHEVGVRLPFLPASVAGDEFRLELRGFDLVANPARLPTRCVVAHSARFRVENVVPRVLKEAAKISAGVDSPAACFAGDRLVEVCAALRRAGVDVPVMLEFEAGQHLTPKGEVIASALLQLLGASGGGASAARIAVKDHFAESGPDRGLTDVQLAAEPAVRRHYALLRPGLSAQEWAENRRAALEHAMHAEFDWWRQDSLLMLAPEELSPVATPSSPQLAPTTCDATLAYARETCLVLSATGRDGMQDDAARPTATVSLRGDGTATRLDIDQGVVSEGALSLEQVLGAVQSAYNAAHVRLNTLAAARNGLTEELVQRFWVDAADGTDLGGIYGPTMADCFERAQRQLLQAAGQSELATAGQQVLQATPESGKDAVETLASERFPGQDGPHSELRRTLFHEARGPMQENLDQPPLESQDPWTS